MRRLEHDPGVPAVDSVDAFLIVLYLLGIYLGVEIRLNPSTPIPTVLSGFAGGMMLLKHMNHFREDQVIYLLLVIALFLATILAASEADLLGKRFTGLLQLAYSFVIGYGLYVTALLFDRASLARIFGWFCALILIGCILESYVEPFRAISDAVRRAIFDFGVYDADRRDIILYGRIRPKLFTSEPSALSFAFVLFSFCWYVLSKWRWKTAGYVAMFAAAFVLMRGPTLLLGLVLLAAYEMFLAPRRETAHGIRYDVERGTIAIVVSLAIAGAALAVGLTFFAERVEAIREGTDPSFFSRVNAPALVAFEVIRERPIAGIGLTAERLVDSLVSQIYAQSGGLLSKYDFGNAKYALTNYFWTHWIYLGMVWGLILVAALTAYLRVLGAPSILFCWSVWAVLGQASGAYVSPKTWTVLYLACVISIIQQRSQWPRSREAREGRARGRMLIAEPVGGRWP